MVHRKSQLTLLAKGKKMKLDSNTGDLLVGYFCVIIAVLMISGFI